MIGQLRKAYQCLNKGLFNGSLPTVKFLSNIQRKQIFFFRSATASSDDVVIEYGSGLATASHAEILDDLLHVMVHIQNWSTGVTDVTQNQYHRIEFCKRALEVGLIVACHPTRGWGLTFSEEDKIEGDKVRRPTKEAGKLRERLYKESGLEQSTLDTFKRNLQKELARRPNKQFQFRYVCQCNPPMIVRVGRKPDGPRPFKAKCMYCNTKFALDDG